MTHTYLALGDSYTIGEQVPSEENFPHQVVAMLNKQGIKVAPPVIIATTGWTTDELLTAIKERAIKDTFTFTTLLIGVNNQYRGRDIENYKQEYTALLDTAIRYANGHTQNVYVLSIPDWGVTPFAEGRDRVKVAHEIDAYNNACKEITLAHKCHYLDITDSTRKNGKTPEYLAGDGLHPSGKEYHIWAERLAPMVAKVLKG
ncbi:MAG: SGNH/GDSL hydrolase family protein [Bacteroidetes bacterium]|nr:SGNH/GDSL hydrolase family protein [Bacteroidota bacterium]